MWSTMCERVSGFNIILYPPPISCILIIAKTWNLINHPEAAIYSLVSFVRIVVQVRQALPVSSFLLRRSAKARRNSSQNISLLVSRSVGQPHRAVPPPTSSSDIDYILNRCVNIVVVGLLAWLGYMVGNLDNQKLRSATVLVVRCE